MPATLPNQRDFFDIPHDLAWINCAAQSPALSSVSLAGAEGLARKRSPWTLGPAQYRDDVEKLRGLFAELIGATAGDISFGPSASYCLSTAAQNLTIEPGSRIVVLADQFPSHVYPWRYVTARDGGELITVPRPEDGDWARAVLDVLDERVAVLALPQHHWTDGGLVDLERIAPVARSCGAALVLDLSQTIGAVPVDVRQLQPDFLCCVGFKWLLGPYSLSFLYSAPHRQSGVPLEQAWSSRADSHLADIIDYRDDFLPGARRYDMGERGNYIAIPMAIAALEQIQAWRPTSIAATLRQKTGEIATRARELGLWPTPEAARAPHIIGLRCPIGLPNGLIERLQADRIYISQRKGTLRISPHLYNTNSDVDRLFEALGRMI